MEHPILVLIVVVVLFCSVLVYSVEDEGVILLYSKEDKELKRCDTSKSDHREAIADAEKTTTTGEDDEVYQSPRRTKLHEDAYGAIETGKTYEG